MARLEWSQQAVNALDRLIETQSLPPDTRARVKRSIDPLAQFPLMGPALQRGDQEIRFLIGPWRWLIVVYGSFADDNRVVIVSVEDGRSASAVTARR